MRKLIFTNIEHAYWYCVQNLLYFKMFLFSIFNYEMKIIKMFQMSATKTLETLLKNIMM